MNNKEIKRKNMINIIYEAEEGVIDEIIKKTDKELKDKLKISGFPKPKIHSVISIRLPSGTRCGPT